MKLKSVAAGVAALLTLSACAEYDNFMDGMSDLKNQGSALSWRSSREGLTCTNL